MSKTSLTSQVRTPKMPSLYTPQRPTPSGSDNSDKTCDLVGLIGRALLTVLSAIDRAGDLKPSSRFLDLALVISYYLELSHDLPAYGIQGPCISWQKEAVLFFQKAHLDPGKALFATDMRLNDFESALVRDFSNHNEKIDNDIEHDESCLLEYGNNRDPWSWQATMNTYRKNHDNPTVSK
jgi:hypothetical protein